MAAATPLPLLRADAVELLERVYASAEGAVYRGRVRATGEAVAVKQRYSSELGRGGDLWHEVRLLQRANAATPAATVPCLGAYEAPRHTLNIVLQWAPGGDLASVLERRIAAAATAAAVAASRSSSRGGGGGHHRGGGGGSSSVKGYLPEPLIWRWLACMFRALAGLHAVGIIHRDVKCSNLLLFPADDLPPPPTPPARPPTSDAELAGYDLRLSDLGVARETVVGEAAAARTFYGTPLYLSPEMLGVQGLGGGRRPRPTTAGGRPGYGTPTDMWSAGVVAYELAALTPPFTAPSLPALADAICGTRAPPLPAHYSAPLVALVAACMSTDPAARPSAADALSTCMVQLGEWEGAGVYARGDDVAVATVAPSPLPSAPLPPRLPPTPPRGGRDVAAAAPARPSAAGSPPRRRVDGWHGGGDDGGGSADGVRVVRVKKHTTGTSRGAVATAPPHLAASAALAPVRGGGGGGDDDDVYKAAEEEHPRDGSLVARARRRAEAWEVEQAVPTFWRKDTAPLSPGYAVKAPEQARVRRVRSRSRSRSASPPPQPLSHASRRPLSASAKGAVAEYVARRGAPASDEDDFATESWMRRLTPAASRPIGPAVPSRSAPGPPSRPPSAAAAAAAVSAAAEERSAPHRVPASPMRLAASGGTDALPALAAPATVPSVPRPATAPTAAVRGGTSSAWGGPPPPGGTLPGARGDSVATAAAAADSIATRRLEVELRRAVAAAHAQEAMCRDQVVALGGDWTVARETWGADGLPPAPAAAATCHDQLASLRRLHTRIDALRVAVAPTPS